METYYLFQIISYSRLINSNTQFLTSHTGRKYYHEEVNKDLEKTPEKLKPVMD